MCLAERERRQKDAHSRSVSMDVEVADMDVGVAEMNLGVAEIGDDDGFDQIPLTADQQPCTLESYDFLAKWISPPYRRPHMRWS